MKMFVITGSYKEIGGDRIKNFYKSISAFSKEDALRKLTIQLGSNNIKVNEIFSYFDQQPIKYKEGF